MENNQPSAPQTQPMPTPQEPHVGFPAPNEPKKSGGVIKWIIAAVGVIAIIVVGAIFVLKPPAESTSETTEEGNVLTAVATPQPTETPTPSPTAEPEPIDKANIAILIQNGTGTPGDASLVKEALEDIDFVDIVAENADDQEETETTLTYTTDVSQQVVDEIEAALTDLFGDVRVRRGTVADDYMISILTGPKADSTDSTDTDTTDTETDTDQ